jgi:hypothetical protein
MARSELVDPLDKFRWRLEIPNFSRAGFTACAVPKFNVTTHAYKEGGAHLHPRQILDSIENNPITLSRGVTSDASFNQWATGIFDLVENQAGLQTNTNPPEPGFLGAVQGAINAVQDAVGPRPANSFNPQGQYRKDISIKHVDKLGQTIVEYNVFGAWVIGYEPASDFDASDDEGFSIESITLAYDGFDVRYGTLSGLASVGLNLI